MHTIPGTLQTLILRKGLLDEPTQNEVALPLATETQQKHHNIDQLNCIGHLTEIGVDCHHHVVDWIEDQLRPDLFCEAADELADWVVGVPMEGLLQFAALGFVGDDVAVCLALHLFVLVDHELER